jgi:hypothetical protein
MTFEQMVRMDLLAEKGTVDISGATLLGGFP